MNRNSGSQSALQPVRMLLPGAKMAAIPSGDKIPASTMNIVFSRFCTGAKDRFMADGLDKGAEADGPGTISPQNSSSSGKQDKRVRGLRG
jgi:hypothetical protein